MNINDEYMRALQTKKLVCLDFGKKRILRNLTTPTLSLGTYFD